MSGFAQITEQIDNELEVNLGKEVYRDITWDRRSVFELNGTQWGVSSEKLDTTSANRVKVTVQFSAIYDATVPRLWSLFTDDTADYFRLQLQSVNNQWVAKVESLGQTPGSGSIVVGDGKFHKIEADCNLITGVIDIYVDGVFDYSVTHAEPERLRREFNVVTGAAYSSTSTGILGQMDGIISYLEISVDDASVKLFKFDDAESAYQRNHAVALGEPVIVPDWSWGGDSVVDSDGVLSLVLPETGSDWVARSTPAVIDPSESYQVVYEILELPEGGGVRINHSANGFQDQEFQYSVGVSTGYIIANGSGFGTLEFYGTGGGVAKVHIISILKWSGVILQNALPERWMQIEKKRYWDYWLGVDELWGKNTARLTGAGWEDLGDGSYLHSGDVLGEVVTDDVLSDGLKYLTSIQAVDGVGSVKLGGPPINGNSETFVSGLNLLSITAESVGTYNAIRMISSGDGVVISNISVRRKLEIAQ